MTRTLASQSGRKQSRQMRLPGRPRRYETPEQMQEVVDTYFASVARPTITGLAIALGFTSRQALLNYEGYSPEFSDAIKRAKLRVEHEYELLLCDPTAKPAAVIFALKNFGWGKRQEPAATDLPPIQVIHNDGGPASVPVPGAGPQGSDRAAATGDA